MRKKLHLVCQHLEKVSRKVIEDFQSELEQEVRHRHGIYALYKGNRLRYVGLASNLRARLKHHLKDRHADSWDRFSIYLTIQSDHLRELEALVIRIASPKDNRQKGKLTKSENLKNKLRRIIKQRQRNEMHELFGTAKQIVEAPKSTLRGRKSTLAAYVKQGLKIEWLFKGTTYRAFIKKNGSIRFRGKIFTSPSSAASSIVKRGIDGWYAWKYERAPGDWVVLNELRK